MNIYTYINCLSYVILFFFPFFVWPNIKNLGPLLSIPPLFLIYILPLFFFESLFESNVSNSSVYFVYTMINLVGAIGFVFGLFLGRYNINIIISPFKNIFKMGLSDEMVFYELNRKLCFSLLFSSGLMIFSYIGMGFVPMFAADPLAAKFFRGVYQELYKPYAIFFRTGNSIILCILPVAILFLLQKANIKLALCVFLSIVCILLTLQRGPVGNAILMGVFFFLLFKKKKYFFSFLFFYMFIYTFGAALWWLLGFAYQGASSFIEGAMAGAPDIFDHMSFLDKFLITKDWTYGLTFLGGLVPSGFKWNPSVYTLRVMNDTDDISNIISGGLRLSVYLWGYTSFSYVGAFFVSFLNAFLMAKQILFVKRLSYDPVSYSVVSVFSSTVIGFFVSFYSFSIYSLPCLLVMVYIFYVFDFKLILRR